MNYSYELSLKFKGWFSSLFSVPSLHYLLFSLFAHLSEYLLILYAYFLANRIAGEWKIKDEDKKVKGHLDIPEFSFGELDDLQV